MEYNKFTIEIMFCRLNIYILKRLNYWIIFSADIIILCPIYYAPREQMLLFVLKLYCMKLQWFCKIQAK